jgi:signal transduction histidine kinase
MYFLRVVGHGFHIHFREEVRIMKKIVLTAAAAALIGLSQLGLAAEFGTAAEAEAMVSKAVEHVRKVGKDQAYADFTAKKPPFFDRDLYVTVLSLGGINLAHGTNPKMVGMDLNEFRDSDGKLFYKERLELVKTKSKFWQDYKFTDPATKKILPKAMYCEKEGDAIICTGIYKR